jgi:phosphohistidine phosphatase
MGSLLRREGLAPDLIVCSSAKRALKTAEAVAGACGFEGQVAVTRDLYHADPESYFSVLRQLGGQNDVVMVVGHNPGMEELLDSLTDEWARMPTAALAEVRIDANVWSSISDETKGELANLWLPRELN